jgi:hypothetical protein
MVVASYQYNDGDTGNQVGVVKTNMFRERNEQGVKYAY